MSRYRDEWRPRVEEAADRITALGSNTSSAAVEVARADEDGAALLAPQGGNQTVLNRNPNAPSVV